MYTLYFSPGSCSLIVNILLEELGIAFEAKMIDLEGGEHRREPYLAVNPKGKVPALVTPEGVLTECVAILEYLCDKLGDGRWLGKPGTWQRAKTLEQVATCATELHPLFGRFFHPDDYSDDPAVGEAVKAHAAKKLLAWFRAEDAKFPTPFWSGREPTLADLYFVVLVRWGRWLTPPVNRMPRLEAFTARMGERPAVQRALAREGIKLFGS